LQPKHNFESTSKLEKLYFILNYQVSSLTLYGGLYFFPMLFLVILIGAEILFTPFIIYVLVLEKKKGWIISFLILVLLPNVLILAFVSQYFMLILFPFYLYCFILRFEAKSWLTEKRARNELIMQKIRSENEKKNLENFIVLR
jgi:hypothetical protein